jgi:hypothetical protein
MILNHHGVAYKVQWFASLATTAGASTYAVLKIVDLIAMVPKINWDEFGIDAIQLVLIGALACIASSNVLHGLVVWTKIEFSGTRLTQSLFGKQQTLDLSRDLTLVYVAPFIRTQRLRVGSGFFSSKYERVIGRLGPVAEMSEGRVCVRFYPPMLLPALGIGELPEKLSDVYQAYKEAGYM